jgi:hypothetical protein
MGRHLIDHDLLPADVSTEDALNRFVPVLGGTLKLIAELGGEQLKIG